MPAVHKRMAEEKVQQSQCCVAQCMFAGCSMYTCVMQTRCVIAFLHLHWHNARQNVEYMKPSIDNQKKCTLRGCCCLHTQVPPFKKVFTETMPYVDYLFGNETEAEAFAESEGWKTKNTTEIAAKARAVPAAHAVKGMMQ